MKFWRIFAAAVVVGLTIPTSVALADDDDDDDDMGPGGINCAEETNKALRTDLTVCPGFMDYTNTFVGNGFPFENSSFFFSSFRNQYLYPSSIFVATSAYACTVESMSARSVSFVGGSTNVYASFTNGDPSFIELSGSNPGSLLPTFALNSNSQNICTMTGTDATPLVIGNRTGIRGSVVSNCTSCILGDAECPLGNIEAPLDATWGDGPMWDMKISVGTGNSGAGVWDTSDTTFGTPPCEGGTPQRAFGSSTFANPNHLTTALGVDGFDFVWVFQGLAPPPPATVEQQIKEIIRLLLTPEALRCSGLDLTPGNGKIEDDPIAFPNGANWDPVQPTVTTGQPKTGDELVDGLRSAGFRP